MGRIEIEEFSEKDISRIFIAASLKEAELVENILSEDGIDYTISLEPYLRIGYLMKSELNGVAFYVLSAKEKYFRDLLASNGLSSGLTVEES